MIDHPEFPPLEVLKTRLYRTPVVYVIHLHHPLRHVRHYVGWTHDLEERMRTHRLGISDTSHFMAAVHAAGITWTLARVYSFETRSEAWQVEKLFKKRRLHTERECPFCRAQALQREAERMRTYRRRRAEALEEIA